jgi:hypothetical protein
MERRCVGPSANRVTSGQNRALPRRGGTSWRRERGRLRVRHGVELQHATPRGGGPRAGDTPRSFAARRRTRTWWRGRQRRYDAISGPFVALVTPFAAAKSMKRGPEPWSSSDARDGRPHSLWYHRRVIPTLSHDEHKRVVESWWRRRAAAPGRRYRLNSTAATRPHRHAGGPGTGRLSSPLLQQ